MAEKTTTRTAGRRRRPLNRQRVLRAALKLADEQGIGAVSMRKLGEVLRVEAMSLYKHVANKEEILDGIADLVMTEIDMPSGEGDWRDVLCRCEVSVHAALLRHPWAGPVLESRLTPGPARLRYLDAVIGVLRGAGFPTPIVARAIMSLDSYTYGFAMQELSFPFTGQDGPQVAAAAAALFAGRYENLLVMAELAAGGDAAIDFEFGLRLILDGLERLRQTE